MQLLKAGTRAVTDLLFAPTNDALVATSDLGVPRVWALPAVDPVPVPVPYVYTSWLTFSPDGNVVGCVCGSRRVEYDRAANTSRAVELTPGNEHVSSQAMCGPDARLIMRTSQFGDAPRICAFVADGRDGWTDLWGVAVEPNLHGELIAGAPRGDRFFAWEDAGGHGRRLVARSALTGDEIANAPLSLRYIEGLVAHPEGDFAVARHSSSLYVWAAGGTVEKVRTGVRAHYRSIAFHPDGHLLAGNNDTTARLIDTHTWQVVRRYVWDIGSLTAVAVSPDGALAAAGGERGQVVVWDLDI